MSSDRLAKLTRLIEHPSTSAGERHAALAAYERIAGRPYQDPAPPPPPPRVRVTHTVRHSATGETHRWESTIRPGASVSDAFQDLFRSARESATPFDGWATAADTPDPDGPARFDLPASLSWAGADALVRAQARRMHAGDITPDEYRRRVDLIIDVARATAQCQRPQ